MHSGAKKKISKSEKTEKYFPMSSEVQRHEQNFLKILILTLKYNSDCYTSVSVFY